jgi:hypothetical protein
VVGPDFWVGCDGWLGLWLGRISGLVVMGYAGMVSAREDFEDEEDSGHGIKLGNPSTFLACCCSIRRRVGGGKTGRTR